MNRFAYSYTGDGVPVLTLGSRQLHELRLPPTLEHGGRRVAVVVHSDDLWCPWSTVATDRLDQLAAYCAELASGPRCDPEPPPRPRKRR